MQAQHDSPYRSSILFTTIVNQYPRLVGCYFTVPYLLVATEHSSVPLVSLVPRTILQAHLIDR